MKPFGQLLDGHELVGAVVELMPDGVKRLVVLSLDPGVGRALGVPGEFVPGLGHVRAGSDADPVAAGRKGFPVGAGDHHMGRVGDDDLLGIQLAEGGGNDAPGDVVATGHLDEQAEVFVAETQAAIVGVAADSLDEHAGTRRVIGLDDVGDAVDLLVAKIDEGLGALFLAEQLAEQAHGRLGVLHRVVAEVDVHHRDAQRVELLDVARIFGGVLRLDIEDDHVRSLGDGLLDVEGAVFKAAEGGDLGDAGKFAQVGVVGVRVGLDQVLAPADDALDRVLRIQRGDQIQLSAFAEDDAPDRQVNLDLAPQQIGHLGARRIRFGGERGARCQENTPPRSPASSSAAKAWLRRSKITMVKAFAEVRSVNGSHRCPG